MRSRRWPLIISTLVLVLGLTACGTSGTGTGVDDTKQVIKFGDTSFQSLWINNAIAGFAIEHGYGYPVENIELTTSIFQQSINTGAVDVHMELWQQNIMKWYNESIEAGTLLNLGPTYERSTQGFYVPRYVVEGDPARGIEATAPDLKSVFDLPKYKELFKDPENPRMGVWINCITGWQCAMVNTIKMRAYGIDEHYNTIEPGASGALDAAIAGAYKRGQPILSYYWEPTWLLGTYDMIQLEEPPYTEECNDEIQRALTNEISLSEVTANAGCAYESIPIDKGVYAGLKDRAPEVVTFLEKMTVGTDALNQTAAYMEAEGVEADAAAIWYFENFQDAWRSWVPADVAERIEKALIAAGAKL